MASVGLFDDAGCHRCFFLLIECASCHKYLESMASPPILFFLYTIDDLTPKRLFGLWCTLLGRLDDQKGSDDKIEKTRGAERKQGEWRLFFFQLSFFFPLQQLMTSVFRCALSTARVKRLSWKATGLQLQSGSSRVLVAGPIGKLLDYKLTGCYHVHCWAGYFNCNVGPVRSEFSWRRALENFCQ